MTLLDSDIYLGEFEGWDTTALFQVVPGMDVGLLGASFSRASVARYTDVDGVVQTAAVDEFRARHYVNGVPTFQLEGSGTNVCLHSEGISSSWTAQGTPTHSSAASIATNVILDRIGDDSLSAIEGYSRTITFTSDGIKGFSLFVEKNSAAQSLIELLDSTSSAERLYAQLSWSSNLPVVSATTGTYLGYESLTGGVFRLLFSTSAITAAHTNTVFLWPACDLAKTVVLAGSLIVGGVQADNDSPFPTSYIPTTTVAVTRSADSLSVPFTTTPQAMTVVAQFIERGSALTGASTGIVSIGSGINASVFACGDGGGHYALFHRRASDVSSGAAAAPAFGQRVALRCLLNSNGSVQIGQSLNGAAEVVASASGANALAGSWHDTTLEINSIGGSLVGFTAFTRVAVFLGIKALVEMPDTTLRVSGGGANGYTTGAGDYPPNTNYPARMQNALMLHRTAFADRATSGRSQPSVGEIMLRNGNFDFDLDTYRRFAFDGRRAVIRRGQSGAAYPNAWTTVLEATMHAPSWDGAELRLNVRDAAKYASVPFQKNYFLGNNVPPDGLEGTADDLLGKPKPVTLGSVVGITPVLVNEDKLIYQVADRGIVSVVVYDEGDVITASGTYATLTDLQNDSLAPAAGHVKVYLGGVVTADGALFRLGSSPAGRLTADVVQDAALTAGGLWETAMAQSGLVQTRDYSHADVTVLDALDNSPVGIYLGLEDAAVTCGDVADRAAQTVGAWWGADGTGLIRIQQLAAPSGSPVVSLDQNDLYVPLTPLTSADDNEGIPPHRTVIRWGRNYTPLTATDLDGAVVGAGDAARLAMEWRDAIYENPPVVAAHPLSQILTVESLYSAEADAGAEAVRRGTLLGADHEWYECGLLLTDALSAVDLGDVVSLTHQRFGLSAGVLFRVMGVQLEAQPEGITIVTFTLWR